MTGDMLADDAARGGRDELEQRLDLGAVHALPLQLPDRFRETQPRAVERAVGALERRNGFRGEAPSPEAFRIDAVRPAPCRG